MDYGLDWCIGHVGGKHPSIVDGDQPSIHAYHVHSPSVRRLCEPLGGAWQVRRDTMASLHPMRTTLLFLPFLGSALLHAPVLRFDLLPVLKRPIDGGCTLNGVRLLGDNKTWRGAVVMTLGVVLATWGLSHVNAYCEPAPVSWTPQI